MMTVYVLAKNLTGHMLDPYCVRLSKAAPFFENYTKLYFDAKHRNLIGGREIFGTLSSKKGPPFIKSTLLGQY